MYMDYILTIPDEKGRTYGMILPEKTLYYSDDGRTIIDISIPAPGEEAKDLYLRRFQPGVLATARRVIGHDPAPGGLKTHIRTWVSNIQVEKVSYDQERRKVLVRFRRLSGSYPEVRCENCTSM